MASHNANYSALNLTGGTYTPYTIGDGVTASTIHQVFCLTDGTINIIPMGGEKITWAATAGQKMDVLTSKVIVDSGTFVGFKSKHLNRRLDMRGNN